jgi:DNA-binding protein H-NS
MTDLSTFSVARLRDLQAQVVEELKSREKDELAKVRQQILALAQSVGMPLDQIMKGAQVKKSGNTVAPRYQNPADPAQQWTGRGRRPNWVKEYMEKPENQLESLLIQ